MMPECYAVFFFADGDPVVAKIVDDSMNPFPRAGLLLAVHVFTRDGRYLGPIAFEDGSYSVVGPIDLDARIPPGFAVTPRDGIAWRLR